MFKVSGYKLPELKQEVQNTGRKGSAKGESPSADSLQNLFNELGRGTSGSSQNTDSVVKTPEQTKYIIENNKQDSRRSKISKNSNKEKNHDRSSKRPRDEDPAEPKTNVKKSKGEKNQQKDQETSLSKKPKLSEEESGTAAATRAVEKNAGPMGRHTKKLSPMQLKMQQKLSGARFRWINEQLYTTDSSEALELFQRQPELFEEYHEGFRHQVESWPENPVHSMINLFRTRLQKPLNAPGGLPADSKNGEVIVADMGCGEAELAEALSTVRGTGKSRRAHFSVHSFDLHKANDRITVADIAHVPLPDKSCHVVVFCLALMGTNLEDFLKEGLRILKPRGELWIAEIKSRFEGAPIDRFVALLRNMGLHHKATDDSNKMFVRFEFALVPGSKDRRIELDEKPVLKPCIYKRR